MKRDVALGCDCGLFKGVVQNVSNKSQHRGICYCDDCQAYAVYLGKEKAVLDSHGGTDIFHTTPSNVKFTQGADLVRGLHLTAKGPHRWFTSCCKTPIANTSTNARLPHVGLMHTIWKPEKDGLSKDEVFGPVAIRAMGKFAIGKPPAGTADTLSLKSFFTILRFFAISILKRRHVPSAFFAGDGKPRAPVEEVSKAQREALKPFTGPDRETKGDPALVLRT
ncbi:MAG: hypothetical protein EOP04_01345 [Proteobacteria bacterium]|nr:MAG: hypothetical protein EOP04_01345 [Pseudomonadota bacterium]